ncbi:class I SAM-dependent methyltransferase [Candidatus Poribacteria bacterium]|nr:class I SAM-dependent methyltransferase [Candidatus Poribacteria bacterium]MYA99138.1 class I SAM-dependent methyltransferase [Candidatus Poribacteria bacterium]
MHQLSDEILSFYRQTQESERLTNDIRGQIEFARTQEIITRYLPDPPAVVLDIGGGSGPYACWLAKAGYEVHLVDPVDLHVEQAKEASNQQSEHPIASISLGDARALRFSSASADAVLLLGPLYHLIDKTERLLALSEAYRVLRNGGVMVAAGISRFASLLSCFFDDGLNQSVYRNIVKRDLKTGYHRNPTDNLRYFTDAYLHRPETLGSEVVEAGFQHQATLAVQGPMWLFRSVENYWADPDQRAVVLDLIRKVEAEPSILGMSSHILAIGRK